MRGNPTLCFLGLVACEHRRGLLCQSSYLPVLSSLVRRPEDSACARRQDDAGWLPTRSTRPFLGRRLGGIWSRGRAKSVSVRVLPAGVLCTR